MGRPTRKSGDIRLEVFKKGQAVWIENTKNSDSMWEEATVEEQTGPFVIVKSKRLGAVNLDLRNDNVFPKNPESQPDMTSLYFINEPCILMNLEARSLQDEPYTFMGNVLVAVNPLKRIPNPGLKNVNPLVPHPFAVGENAFSQMLFSFDHPNISDESLSQSVITSGESGAGKTESCKMVLQCLVAAAGSALDNIDKKLLQSNAITESFGNSQTLRNHNSSRFGKFMKLHFEKAAKSGDSRGAWSIIGASIETYLLERSRVTLHNSGERNFHVFYHLLAGLSSKQKDAYGINQAIKTTGFRYLSVLENAESSCKKDAFKAEILSEDKNGFTELVRAFEELQVDQTTVYSIFKILAGVLHLGNIEFNNKTHEGNDIAEPKAAAKGYDAVQYATELLGLSDTRSLTELFSKEEIVVRNKTIVKFIDKSRAVFIRDALAKSIYNAVFDFVISLIGKGLGGFGLGSDSPFIGILDIFGFETFKRNGYEQLLINFANESLQATFNRSVFEAEAALYKREGLVFDSADRMKAPSNSSCMELFLGRVGRKGKSPLDRGLLLTIDDESQSIEPTDHKMLSNLHRAFSKHRDYGLPHARHKHEQFVISHFAGDVKYTVGFFVEKNKDKLPKAMEDTFQSSSSVILKSSFKGFAQRKPSATVVKKFKNQIDSLIETLESTKCSFIRCVKPNKEMQRDSSSKWFNRRYVSMQLRYMAIPQTAEVLQNGFPTRLPYEALFRMYKDIMPADAIRQWKTIGEGKTPAFVKALFWAFEIDQTTFKMGTTRVFFRAGELARVNELLQAANQWKSGSSSQKSKVVNRFKFFFIRLRWRRAYAKVYAFNQFLHILENIRDKSRAIEREKERAAREEQRKIEIAKREAEEAERLKLEAERLEAERLEEQRRIEQQLEEERKRREQQRIAEEKKRALKEEQERLLREKERLRREEEERRAAEEEARKLKEEEDRLAKEAKRLELERIREQKRLERQREEEKRREERMRIAEEKRQALLLEEEKMREVQEQMKHEAELRRIEEEEERKIKEQELRLRMEEARLKEEQEMMERNRLAAAEAQAKQIEAENRKLERERQQREYEERKQLEDAERQRLQEEQRLLAEAEKLEHNRAAERRKIQKEMAKERKRIEKEMKKYEVKKNKIRKQEEKERIKEENRMKIEAERMEKARMEEIKEAMKLHEEEKKILAEMKEQRERRQAQEAWRQKMLEESKKNADKIRAAIEEEEKLERQRALNEKILEMEKEQEEVEAMEKRLRETAERERELESARIRQEKKLAAQRIKNQMEELNRKLAHVEAQQKEKEELEKQQKLEEALEEVSKGVGLLGRDDVSVAQLKEDKERIKQLYDEIEAMANKQVNEKFKSRGSSITSEIFQKEAQEVMEKLESTYASIESQARAEEKAQRAEYTILSQGYDVYIQTVEAAKSWFQPLLNQVLNSETWNAIRETNDRIVTEVRMTFIVMNKLLLRQARKQDWFVKAESRLNKIRNTFLQEMNAEKEKRGIPRNYRNGGSNQRNTLRRQASIGGGGNGVRRLNSVMVLRRQDADRPAEAALEHIDKVKAMIESGEIPPSAMKNLQEMMEDISGTGKRMTLKRRYNENRFQHDYRKQVDDDEESNASASGFPDVRPSDDGSIAKCRKPIQYKSGYFYFGMELEYEKRDRSVKFLCGWEHSNPKMSKTIFAYWNAFPSVASIAQIYDALLQSSAGAGDAVKIPEFPGWIAKNYPDENSSKSSTELTPLDLLRYCIDYSVIEKNPSLVGYWLQDIFEMEMFNSKNTNVKAQKRLVHIIKVLERAFDLDLNAGANLFASSPRSSR